MLDPRFRFAYVTQKLLSADWMQPWTTDLSKNSLFIGPRNRKITNVPRESSRNSSRAGSLPYRVLLSFEKKKKAGWVV